MHLKMKAAIIYVTLFACVSTFPKDQHFPPLRSLYVDAFTESETNGLEPRIINGREAVPHSIPYQAHLVILSSGIGGWTCGGSLISPTHVLTAAHCLVSAAGAYVHLGAHNIGGPIETTQIIVESRNLIVHEDYNETTISDDIGLIVLDEPVELNQYIDVVDLVPRGINTDFTGYNATVSGWGLTSGGGNRASVLQEANVTVISNFECRQVYSIVIDSHLCTLGNDGESICDGDSGGPLVADDYQIGIVSYGSGGCSGNYPSGYTRVTNYLNWLEENTGLRF